MGFAFVFCVIEFIKTSMRFNDFDGYHPLPTGLEVGRLCGHRGSVLGGALTMVFIKRSSLEDKSHLIAKP